MKQRLASAVVAATLGIGVASCATAGGPQVLVRDDFASRDKLIDLTLVTLWGTNTSPTSALTLVNKSDASGLTYTAIKMADAAAPHSLWKQDLRTATCFDYEFGPVHRTSSVVIVEFDAFWDVLESGRRGNWGEGNRVAVMLMHDYPRGGPKFGELEKIEHGHPFGRPAYHFRIRNIHVGMGAMMSYGGGPAGPRGEFEKYNDDDKLYWLPGFVSSTAKGQAPGDEVSYDGTKSPYPKTPTQKGGRVASDREWRHVTWKVHPERLELFYRPSHVPVDADQLVFFMDIPRIPAGDNAETHLRKRLAASHGLERLKQLPALYNWFPTVRAIRFYLRGNKAYLSNVRITVYPTDSDGDSRRAERDTSSLHR